MPDVVGLTVQQRSVRGVEARVGRKNRCTVLRTAEVELPAATFDSGRLVDQAAFTACLEELWAQGGFKSKRVQLVIDGRLAVIRRTELPSLGAAQLRKAASYDIAELLSYPIADAVFDVDEIERFDRNGTTWAKALVVAVEATTLAELGASVKAAGLHLIGTDLAAEALARGVRADDRRLQDEAEDETPHTDQPVAVLDCEDATTNIVVRDASGVLFARTLSVGVGESTISVADELESALAQLSGSEEDLDAGPAGAGVSAVVESIRRTLSYYTAELDDRPIASISVAGARGQAPGLLGALEQTLAVPARPAQQVGEWPNGITIHGFETPLGAAMGVAGSTTRHLVLTSDRERAARSKKRQQIAALATGVPVVVFLVLAGLNLRTDVNAARATAEQSEAATDRLALRLAELDSSAQRIRAWQVAVDEVASLQSQQLRLDLVITELAAAMPADTRILSIDLQRGVTGDLPTGYDGQQPAGIVTITGIAEDINGVGRWIAAVDGTEVIDGLWLQQSTYGPVGTDGQLGALFSVNGVITAAAAPDQPLIDTELNTQDVTNAPDEGDGT